MSLFTVHVKSINLQQTLLRLPHSFITLYAETTTAILIIYYDKISLKQLVVHREIVWKIIKFIVIQILVFKYKIRWKLDNHLKDSGVLFITNLTLAAWFDDAIFVWKSAAKFRYLARPCSVVELGAFCKHVCIRVRECMCAVRMSTSAYTYRVAKHQYFIHVQGRVFISYWFTSYILTQKPLEQLATLTIYVYNYLVVVVPPYSSDKRVWESK